MADAACWGTPCFVGFELPRPVDPTIISCRVTGLVVEGGAEGLRQFVTAPLWVFRPLLLDADEGRPAAVRRPAQASRQPTGQNQEACRIGGAVSAGSHRLVDDGRQPRCWLAGCLPALGSPWSLQASNASNPRSVVSSLSVCSSSHPRHAAHYGISLAFHTGIALPSSRGTARRPLFVRSVASDAEPGSNTGRCGSSHGLLLFLGPAAVAPAPPPLQPTTNAATTTTISG